VAAIGGRAPLLPRWRENSVPSFLAAARAGAEFVEYDVQVTSDGVPVIWHDDTLEFGDPASPQSALISELTSAEFAAIGRLSAVGAGGLLTAVRRFWHKPSRSQAVARWKCEEDGGFPTLAELFDVVPAEVGFDIEVKMATPDTLARTPATEIDRMLGPILDVVNHACTLNPANCHRPLIFTSFDPDICSELRARVGTKWPVLFLTTGGMDEIPHADSRRNSLAAAIAFATANDLSGIVADTDAIATSPDSVAIAKGLGLSVATYGLRNDDPAWVLAQDRLGVHAAIVDDVAGVVEGLLAARTATLKLGCCGELVAASGTADVVVQSLVTLGAEE
jgi:glycerophosphodiester phosphodiesterase